MSLVPMDKVVRDACRAMGDGNYSKYMTVIQHANAAYRDLSLYVIPYIDEMVIRSEVLKPGVTKAVHLPEDFVYETKVGVCRGNHIFVLAVNNDMCTDGIDDQSHCGCPEEDVEQVENVLCGCSGNGLYPYTFYNGNFNGTLGELYGLGLGRNVPGYYKIDKKKNILYLDVFSEDDKVIVEYKSNGVGDGAEMIPRKRRTASKNIFSGRCTALPIKPLRI